MKKKGMQGKEAARRKDEGKKVRREKKNEEDREMKQTQREKT